MIPIKIKTVYEASCLVIGLFSALMLSVSIVNSLSDFNSMIIKVNSEATDYGSLRDYAKEIASYIGEDTYSGGVGSSALFFEIGRDKGDHIFYIMDMEEAKKHEAILVMDHIYEWVPDSYEMEKEFKYRDTAFGYFTRRKVAMEEGNTD